MSKDAGTLTNREITSGNISNVEVKRPHHWFVESSESGLLPIKKQALGYSSSCSFAGVSSSSVTSWGNMSGFNVTPSQLSERWLDTDTVCDINFDKRIVQPVDNRRLIMDGDSAEDISSFELSMSHSPKDSMFGIDNGGFKKDKFNEVRDSENLMPMRPSNDGEVSVGTTAYGYSKVDDSGFSTVLTNGRENVNGLSMRRANLDIGDRSETGSGILPSISFRKSNTNIMSMPENLCKGDFSVISMDNQSKKDDNMSPMNQGYYTDSCISASRNCSYEVQVSPTSTSQSSSKRESYGLSVGQPVAIRESSIISFGGQHNDASSSGRLIHSYDLPMCQTEGQILDTYKPKDLDVTDANPGIFTAQALSTGAETASKRKEELKSLKLIPLNIFPSNVRSLLSTGILDEVPVKYTAWSQEKDLHGIINGSGYLCGCMSCNFLKVINAYEFERHAGCKTKHPNNHIYFDNGKTIYAVVQELRSTPQNKLFDVIQTVTGSPINQKSFRLWKESYLAATRELERIYSKEDRKQLL